MSFATPLTVLILEDDDADAQAWKRFLEIEDDGQFDCTVVAWLDEAMDLVSTQIYDAVLLDQRLPDGEGLELLSHLPDDRPIGVVTLTGYQDAQLAVRAMEAGVHGFLLKKDVNPDALRLTLLEAVGKARAQFERRTVLRRLETLIEELAGKLGDEQALEQLIGEARELTSTLTVPDPSGERI